MSITAPSARARSSLNRLPPGHEKTAQSMPSAAAPQARAMAWLPAEAPATPRARSSASSAESRLTTPRALNDPVCWSSSALSRSPGARSERVEQRRPPDAAADRLGGADDVVSGGGIAAHVGDPRGSMCGNSRVPAENARVSMPADAMRRRHPVRLVVRDELDRRRLTVLFRLVLAHPPPRVARPSTRLAAIVIAFVTWLFVLVLGRVPKSLHRFLANYTRYTAHLPAYLCLAADPYPRLQRDGQLSGRPRDRPAGKQRRLGAAFRLVLAIPAFVLVVGARAGRRVFARHRRVSRAGARGHHRGARLVRLPRARARCRGACATPPRTRSATAAQTTAYALLLTDRYPDATPGRADPAPELPPHPVAIRVDDELARPRLLVLFRLPLCIPHLLWLTVWSAFAARRLHPRLGRGARHRPRAAAAPPVPRRLRPRLDAPALLPLRRRAAVPRLRRPRGRVPDRPADRGAACANRGSACCSGWCSPSRRSSSPARTRASRSSSRCSAGSRRSRSAGCRGGLRDLGVAALRYQAQVNAYVLLLTWRYPDSSPVLVGARRAATRAAGRGAGMRAAHVAVVLARRRGLGRRGLVPARHGRPRRPRAAAASTSTRCSARELVEDAERYERFLLADWVAAQVVALVTLAALRPLRRPLRARVGGGADRHRDAPRHARPGDRLADAAAVRGRGGLVGAPPRRLRGRLPRGGRRRLARARRRPSSRSASRSSS